MTRHANDTESFGEDRGAEEMRALIGGAFATRHMDRPLGRVAERGRTLRRRRNAVPVAAAMALTGAAAVTAFQPTAAGHPAAATGSNSAPGSAQASAASNGLPQLNVDLAGFSLVSDPRAGTVSITFKQLLDAAELNALLAHAGIHASVQEVTEQVEGCQLPGGLSSMNPRLLTQRDSLDPTTTIVPADIPAGDTLGVLLEETPRGELIGLSAKLYTGTVPPCVMATPPARTGKSTPPAPSNTA